MKFLNSKYGCMSEMCLADLLTVQKTRDKNQALSRQLNYLFDHKVQFVRISTS